MKYHIKFKNFPFALLENDFSDVKKYIVELQLSGVADFRKYIVNNNEELARLITLVKHIKINDTARNLFRISKCELKNCLSDFFVEESYAGFIELISLLTQGYMNGSFKTILKTADNKIIHTYISWAVPPYYKKSLKKVYFTVTDTSERNNNFEPQLLSEKLSRLASIGIIASGTTHEIYQHLTSIKLNVDSMTFWHFKNSGFIPDQFIHKLDNISDSVSKIDEIIKHMRSFWSFPTREVRQKLNLNKVIIKALSFLERQLSSHGIEKKLNLCESELIILGNEIFIEQVILNLVVNAMQSLDIVESMDKTITICTKRENEWAILQISDNGHGIPIEIIDNIFDPFFSTKYSTGGMGIGLSIVKKYVESFGGSVEARNNQVEGASFVVHFPLCFAEENIDGDSFSR